MPELPEVETTRRGIAPWLVGRRIRRAIVRQPQLRWPVPADLAARLDGARVRGVDRRAKYLLIDTSAGVLLSHLGMSGSWRVVTDGAPPASHDHVDLALGGGVVIRYHDPRRFGCLLWAGDPPGAHPLLRELGPEPLGDDFDGDTMYRMSRGRRQAVKTFLMDPRVVVGVGNIYASEALSVAGVHPLRAAGRVAAARYDGIAAAVRDTLSRSIEMGGTTLRDFINPGGMPGYFEQTLRVYGRRGEPCRACGAPIRHAVVGQRSTFWCPRCQR